MRWHTDIKSKEFLNELSQALQKVDGVIMAVIRKRMSLAELVEEWKHIHGDLPILREKIEKERLSGFAELAKNGGIDPDFARALLYLIMSESRKVQIKQKQTRTSLDQLHRTDKQGWFNHLRRNLLDLTAEIATTYDNRYKETAPFATKTYLDFEDNVIATEIKTLEDLGMQSLAIDLGCATGRTTTKLSPKFEKVIGYDISPEMIKTAENNQTRATNYSQYKNIEFLESDIEEKIPLDDSSVSLVVINMGTASDVYNIELLLAKITRILKPNGRFVLSFYNSEALFYQWPIPWFVGLTAEIDLIKHCLNVQCNGKIFQIHAKAYNVKGIKGILKKQESLRVSKILTYPTIASILPSEFFHEKESMDAITSIDRKLSEMGNGAYILVTGRKIDKDY